MRASRVLVGVVARSLAEVEDKITAPQLRVLVMVGASGPINLGEVARALDVHPSNATRTCDRLVAAGFLVRGENPADRRNLALTLTAEGRDLVATIMQHRRAAIQAVVTQMPARRRSALAPVLDAFATAAGERDADSAAVLGWVD